MFTLIAALVFATALIIAAGTMAFMFTTYREKAVAALLYKPASENAPVYHVAVRRSRTPATAIRALSDGRAVRHTIALAA